MSSSKKNEGFQAFSQANNAVLTREQAEEAAAIAANLMDGQKSIGQSMQDPYTASVHYLEKHRIVEIFQVTVHMHYTHTHTYTNTY